MNLTLHRLLLPLARTFTISRESISTQPSLIVELEHDGEIESELVFLDDEFRALIPRLATEEYAALETSILSEGCRDALVVWKGYRTLLDGLPGGATP